MEHWAGVMAWEVRRLERVSSETQARFNRQSRHIDTSKEREAAMLKQMGELESHLDRRGERINQLQEEMSRGEGRTKELEEMVVELGRRERGVEEECRGLQKQLRGMEVEKEGWEVQRRAIERDTSVFESERSAWTKERDEWTMHKKVLADEMDKLMRDRQRMLDAGKTGERDSAALGGVKARLGAVLQRPVTDVEGAVNEVLARKEREIETLRKEMQEANAGWEDELRRAREDKKDERRLRVSC